MRLIVVTLIAATLAGCGVAARRQAEDRLNSLVGQHVDEAVKAIGPPTSKEPLSTGGAVWSWDLTRQVTRGGGSITTSTPTLIGGQWVNVPGQMHLPTRGDTRRCLVLLTVSAASRVESWKAVGDGC